MGLLFNRRSLLPQLAGGVAAATLAASAKAQPRPRKAVVWARDFIKAGGEFRVHNSEHIGLCMMDDREKPEAKALIGELGLRNPLRIEVMAMVMADPEFWTCV